MPQDQTRSTSPESLLVREIAIDDAEAAAQLSGELGYPVSVDAMQKRIRTVQDLPDHVVYVACAGPVVIGWIDVGVVHHLQGEPYGEIGGFVVSGAYRSQGVGRILLAKAESWIRERGITQVVVRSRITRESAHRFYLREGYSRTKTSVVFSKELPVLTNPDARKA